MTYIPTEWEHGDTITAEKLNKLENGLADCCGGGSDLLIVSESFVQCPNNPSTTFKILDKTWQQIRDACDANKIVFLKSESSQFGSIHYDPLSTIANFMDAYSLMFGSTLYEANTANDYPSTANSTCQGDAEEE